jgi:hypothetical protein
MPYKNKSDRDPHQEMLNEKKKPEARAARAERQRARRALAKKGVKVPAGMDVSHVKALSKGGSNKNGVKLQPASKNRSFPRNSDGSMK